MSHVEPRRPWLFDELRARYEHPLEVEAYTRQVRDGLLAEEAALLARVAPPPGPALVLGCGAGREAFALAEAGYAVTGADISAAMLAAARRLAAGRSTPPIAWVWMPDPLRIPLPDRSFVLVTAFAQLLSHIPGRAERVALLREVTRVLRPGGIFAASYADRAGAADLLAGEGDAEPDEGADDPLTALEREAGWEEGDILVWHPSDAELDEPLFFHLHTRAALAGELEEAGLTDVDFRLPRELTPNPAPDAHRYPFVVARRP